MGCAPVPARLYIECPVGPATRRVGPGRNVEPRPGARRGGHPRAVGRTRRAGLRAARRPGQHRGALPASAPARVVAPLCWVRGAKVRDAPAGGANQPGKDRASGAPRHWCGRTVDWGAVAWRADRLWSAGGMTAPLQNVLAPTWRLLANVDSVPDAHADELSHLLDEMTSAGLTTSAGTLSQRAPLLRVGASGVGVHAQDGLRSRQQADPERSVEPAGVHVSE
jgi:hypothetical protein